MNAFEGLPQLLNGSGRLGLTELPELLCEIVHGADVSGLMIEQERLNRPVYRLRLDCRRA